MGLCVSETTKREVGCGLNWAAFGSLLWGARYRFREPGSAHATGPSLGPDWFSSPAGLAHFMVQALAGQATHVHWVYVWFLLPHN